MEMSKLDGFDMQRRIGTDEPDAEVQLHGFCDASERRLHLHKNGRQQRRHTNRLSLFEIESSSAQSIINAKTRVVWSSTISVTHAANKKLPVFVAHRLGEIQELTSMEDWKHVNSEENAADILSRGCDPKDLRDSTLWWNGPSWLRNDSFLNHDCEPETLEDLKDDEESQSLQRSREVQKFADAVGRRVRAQELESVAGRIWIDSRGGRLRNAEVQYTVKHPWILPSHSKLTELIIEYEHRRNFYSGADATLATVRSRPRLSQQVMRDLPDNRVIPARPFSKVGVDFCGPIYIRESGRRNIKRTKAYIAVFICMIVKAVHLEVVSDMTTDIFIGVFKRFISRRGKPSDVFSDNGTNFVGANRELELKKFFSSEIDKNKIIDNIALEGIK
ncbi:uncharacterized protein [Anoplolepis gracilipes]|uniref:uncharacterized protein n=1 Tax=Anoplolepis gracilipes TaxID=354296 RepID=UPI003BA00097